MDNPLMAHLISPELQNKKDILFGNMEEIYHFHNRWDLDSDVKVTFGWDIAKRSLLSLT